MTECKLLQRSGVLCSRIFADECCAVMENVLHLHELDKENLISFGFLQIKKGKNAERKPTILGLTKDVLIIIQENAMGKASMCRYKVLKLQSVVLELSCNHFKTMKIEYAKKKARFYKMSPENDFSWSKWVHQVSCVLPCQPAPSIEEIPIVGTLLVEWDARNPFSVMRLSEDKKNHWKVPTNSTLIPNTCNLRGSQRTLMSESSDHLMPRYKKGNSKGSRERANYSNDLCISVHLPSPSTEQSKEREVTTGEPQVAAKLRSFENSTCFEEHLNFSDARRNHKDPSTNTNRKSLKEELQCRNSNHDQCTKLHEFGRNQASQTLMEAISKETRNQRRSSHSTSYNPLTYQYSSEQNVIREHTCNQKKSSRNESKFLVSESGSSRKEHHTRVSKKNDSLNISPSVKSINKISNTILGTNRLSSSSATKHCQYHSSHPRDSRIPRSHNQDVKHSQELSNDLQQILEPYPYNLTTEQNDERGNKSRESDEVLLNESKSLNFSERHPIASYTRERKKNSTSNSDVSRDEELQRNSSIFCHLKIDDSNCDQEQAVVGSKKIKYHEDQELQMHEKFHLDGHDETLHVEEKQRRPSELALDAFQMNNEYRWNAFNDLMTDCVELDDELSGTKGAIVDEENDPFGLEDFQKDVQERALEATKSRKPRVFGTYVPFTHFIRRIPTLQEMPCDDTSCSIESAKQNEKVDERKEKSETKQQKKKRPEPEIAQDEALTVTSTQPMLFPIEDFLNSIKDGHWIYQAELLRNLGLRKKRKRKKHFLRDLKESFSK